MAALDAGRLVSQRSFKVAIPLSAGLSIVGFKESSEGNDFDRLAKFSPKVRRVHIEAIVVPRVQADAELTWGYPHPFLPSDLAEPRRKPPADLEADRLFKARAQLQTVEAERDQALKELALLHAQNEQLRRLWTMGHQLESRSVAFPAAPGRFSYLEVD